MDNQPHRVIRKSRVMYPLMLLLAGLFGGLAGGGVSLLFGAKSVAASGLLASALGLWLWSPFFVLGLHVWFPMPPCPVCSREGRRDDYLVVHFGTPRQPEPIWCCAGCEQVRFELTRSLTVYMFDESCGASQTFIKRGHELFSPWHELAPGDEAPSEDRFPTERESLIIFALLLLVPLVYLFAALAGY